MSAATFHVSEAGSLYIYITADTFPRQFIRYDLLVAGWTHFCCQNCLLHPKSFVRFWSMLIWWHRKVATDLSAAHSWCKSPAAPHTKGGVMDWDLVTMEVIWGQWTHCNVQESNFTQCVKKISPTPLHQQQQRELLIQVRVDPWFYVIYIKFWPSHPNTAASFFQSFIVPFWALVKSKLLADSGIYCGLLLL